MDFLMAYYYLQSGINRNILECKDSYETTYVVSLAVLIETYWNVKSGEITPKCPRNNCINRNILECKDRCRDQGQTVKTVLIETYWNVKDCRGNGHAHPWQY